MTKCVAAIKAMIGSKCLPSMFENNFMQSYLKLLDSKHSPPYCLERVHIMEVFIDGGMLDLGRILKE